MSDPNTAPPRFRPKTFPAPEFPPRRPALFARMPPAVFPALMGLLGLGLALRRALPALSLPEQAAETVLGIAVALWAFAALGYGVKIARRPAVVTEDLRVLPGRAGLAAGSLGLMLTAAALVPYAPGLARGLLFAGLALHAVLAALILRYLIQAPPEGRGVTPVWHLHFVGFIIGALSALPLGMTGLAQGLFWISLAAAAAIWAVSLGQLIRRIPPAPLRPLLAIHLAPASLLTTVAAGLGDRTMALICAGLAGLIAVALLSGLRWITAAGFSALWGAFTFPLAALCSALYAIGADVTATLFLIVAVGAIPVIVLRILQAWAKGTLAAKTNAAEA